MSNHAHRRPLSRLGRHTGGPRAKHPHRRLLTRLYWANQRMIAEIDAELGDTVEDHEVQAPKLVWGYGCGPGQQQVIEGAQALAFAGLAVDTDPVQGARFRVRRAR